MSGISGEVHDPDNAREEYNELATGIKVAAPHQLLTYHASSTHSSADVWDPQNSWLDVSMIYTYFRGFNKAWNKIQPDVYEVASLERRKTPNRPFILGESTYESEHEGWGSALQVRKQAYWAMLSGACGHAYGSPNWKMPSNWRDMIELPGARSLRHMADLFSDVNWHLLEPDEMGRYFSSARGPYGQNDYAAAAVTADRSVAIAYIPSSRSIECDKLLSETATISWFDPADGTRRSADSDFSSSPDSITFTSPGPNSEGDEDWVLLIAR